MVNYLRRMKKMYGYTNQQIAKMSGVPLGTVQKIFSGETRHPRYDTLKKLEKVFTPSTYRYPEDNGESAINMLRDSAVRYDISHDDNSSMDQVSQMSGYTLEDYWSLPDDLRVELIDGVFYNMTAPASIHQLIAGQIYAAFLSCIEEHHMSCIPFIAPTDVRLHCDDRTMLEPDVFIVCDRNKILEKYIMGAPDLVVEILSKSTRVKDMTTKLSHYKQAGVREYWIVDPEQRKIIVYLLEIDMDILIYGFEDRIPIGISKGQFFIDFSAISRYVSFLNSSTTPTG